MRSHIAIAFVALVLPGCGPGVADGEYPIVSGYVFTDAGGMEKTISYRGNLATQGIVVDARVDKYRVVGTRIVVARRPRLIDENAGSPRTALSEACEHWVIDTGSHVVSRLDEKSPEAALACNAPGEVEFNPRL
jgi:hypothetical protein